MYAVFLRMRTPACWPEFYDVLLSSLLSCNYTHFIKLYHKIVHSRCPPNFVLTGECTAILCQEGPLDALRSHFAERFAVKIMFDGRVFSGVRSEKGKRGVFINRPMVLQFSRPVRAIRGLFRSPGTAQRPIPGQTPQNWQNQGSVSGTRGVPMKRSIFLGISFLVASAFVLASAVMVLSNQDVGVIVVDVQGDFTTAKKGSLAVPGTDDAFIAKMKKATEALKTKGLPIFATQDWHPTDHISFNVNHSGKKPFDTVQLSGKTQVLWPPHCIQGTENADILLDKGLFAAVVQKGTDKRFDCYSGFVDDGGTRTELDAMLKKNNIKEVIVYGIATDYCVKATAIDAANAGYKVIVIEGLCKGVAPDTTEKALEEMKAKGITVKNELES
jgi:nicotinamidase/pyrazinamidase